MEWTWGDCLVQWGLDYDKKKLLSEISWNVLPCCHPECSALLPTSAFSPANNCPISSAKKRWQSIKSSNPSPSEGKAPALALTWYKYTVYSYTHNSQIGWHSWNPKNLVGSEIRLDSNVWYRGEMSAFRIVDNLWGLGIAVFAMYSGSIFTEDLPPKAFLNEMLLLHFSKHQIVDDYVSMRRMPFCGPCISFLSTLEFFAQVHVQAP